MVDGVNFNQPVGQSNGNSKDAPKIYRDSAPKVSIFTNNGQQNVTNDSTTQGFQMFRDSAPILDGGDSTKTDTGYQLFRDSAPKLSSANSEEPTIDGGTLPEVVVTPKPKEDVATIDGGTLPEVEIVGQRPNKDVATIDGGTLPEVEIVGQRPNKDVATIDGGTLPEVEVTGKKPNKDLANNAITQETQVAVPKHKKGFFAWLGRTLGFSKG